MISIPLFTNLWQEPATLLETKVTIRIYAAEILESVISRINVETGQNIRYNTVMLLPFKAKAWDYRNVSVKEILEDQLAGTPLKYKLLKKSFTIYSAETNDYSTNILT